MFIFVYRIYHLSLIPNNKYGNCDRKVQNNVFQTGRVVPVYIPTKAKAESLKYLLYTINGTNEVLFEI